MHITNKVGIYILSILHLLVDGLCAYTVFNKLYLYDSFIITTIVFILYNILAFSLQPFVGLLIDKYHHEKVLLNISLIILILASIVNLPWFIITIMLGVSNSIFHVVGGIYTVKYNIHKMTYLGLFVALGATGLALGTNISNFIMFVIMLILTFILGFIINFIKFESNINKNLRPIKKENVKYLLLLSIVVLIRAIMGSACKPSVEVTLIELISISIGISLGKIFGGILSDKIGIKYTTIITLTMSLIGYFFFRNNLVIYIISTILFNTTMPITLYLSNNLLEDHYGLSFGTLAFMLYPGYLLGSLYTMLNLSIYPLICISIILSMIVILYVNNKQGVIND